MKLTIATEEIVFTETCPAVVITDAGKALMTAVAGVYPKSFNQLCLFINQWWIDGTAERWTKLCISRYPNFGISTSSRVEEVAVL
ncbi:hypothetical protein POJ06DRAFT_253825 [Lipomyces tetrasporus]|uniref:Uncharacterized protein n=1 Tax=Lipomyces tetrasporus TaxID=54092 RepID=A0AAD7QQC2_9ASCO|nr:uncharacterized protein POJ06DRAFT_253825 [Lipomyces tetrasporus]KAJ8099529.1 hypothetical protein POJ06DRAFT_253825 [Lipomyces tetrasporus]